MKPVIAITCSSITDKAEPFIENLKDYLDGTKYYLHGDNLPDKAAGYGDLNIYPQLGERLLNKILRREIKHPLVTGIKKFLTDHGVNIVLSEYGSSGAKMAPVCAGLNIPQLVYFHGGDIYVRLNVKNFWDEYQYMFQTAAGIIAVSDDMKNDLIEIGCPAEKTYVIPCAAEDRFFNIQPAFTSPVFLFIGRFVDKKAPYYNVLAFKEVLKVIPNARMILVGSGELQDVTYNLVRYYGLEKNVELVGWCNHKQLEQYITDATCYIQHSVIAADGDAEGTPVSIMECSAAGLPVISTLHKGIKQAVIHNKTGFLVNEHDVNSMVQYMIKLGSDMDLSRQMGAEGKKHIAENYSMKNYVGNVNELIRKVLSEKR